ncbi:hypothetical protein V3C99_006129 [Haemonchus contortus]|uniref:Inositol-1-monophosphatase n=1 Tax=Haemonchus contortus TaxID=6289 RepID=A0A7I4XU21_HAECO
MLISVLRYCTKAAMFTGISRKPVACFVKISYSTMVFKPVHPDEQKFVDTALALVKEAGRLVRDAFDQPNCVVKTKASNVDLVTETDQAVEKLLIQGLSKAFPDHKFIGEESTANGAAIEYTNAPTWIIDPIDGTTNFVHRIPLVAICVGLAINKELRAGIVYNPISRELYFAQVGCGAFKNGFPIHVSNTTALNRSLITASLAIHNYNTFGPSWLDKAQSNMRRQVEAGIRGSAIVSAISNSVVITQLGSHRYPEMLHSYTSSYKTLMVDQNCHGHRCFGSAAINMMMVAQGGCDAMVEYGIHAWDVAAAAVIVSEAGGCLIDPTGGPFNVMSRKVLCASTMELARSLSGLLTHAEYEPEG